MADNGNPPPAKTVTDFPCEITFKAVFRNRANIDHVITAVLSKLDIIPDIKLNESSKGTFVSCTITAMYPSEGLLQNACSVLSSIEGFMTMF
jgi:putative lipoic acid-binding regulatory protein